MNNVTENVEHLNKVNASVKTKIWIAIKMTWNCYIKKKKKRNQRNRNLEKAENKVVNIVFKQDNKIVKSNERQRFKDRERLRPLLALSLSGCGIVGGFIPVVGRDIFSPLSYALLLTNMQAHTHIPTHT